MSSICTATKRDGSPCTLPSNSPSQLCWAHDPKNQERRRRGQSRGGKNKPSRELIDLKSRLSVLATDVLEGKVNTGRASVAGQILNTYIRAISVEMKLREVEEIAKEVEELRELLETREKENSRWRYGG